MTSEPEYEWVEVSPGRQRRVRKGEYEAPADQAAFFFKGDDLSKEDRASLERLIGRPVHDMAEARAAMAEKGLRFVEKGERNSQVRKELREWAAEAPDKRGPMPEAFRQRRNVERVDIRKLYEQVREGKIPGRRR